MNQRLILIIRIKKFQKQLGTISINE